MRDRLFKHLKTNGIFGAVVLAAVTVFGSAASAFSTPRAETGLWLNDSQEAAIEIYVCQDRQDRLCGRIVWLKEPMSTIDGQPKRDRYNSNERMKSRPICGLPILGNLAADAEGGLDGGWIYDPKKGQSYDAAIKLTSPERLEVRGYVGVKFLGKSFTWTRLPADSQRCEGAPPPA